MENQNCIDQRFNGGDWSNQRNEEFQESDVWELNHPSMGSIDLDTTGNNNQLPDLWDINTNVVVSSNRQRPVGLLSKRLAAVMSISGARTEEDTHTQTSNREEKLVHSAPVNVPDWSKIYGRSPRRKTVYGYYHDAFKGDEDYESDDDDDDDDDEEEEDDDDGDEEWRRSRMLPPHEWLARKEISRSKTMSPSSVSEGLGRTLKGRDLTRVRNAVLAGTGYL